MATKLVSFFHGNIGSLMLLVASLIIAVYSQPQISGFTDGTSQTITIKGIVFEKVTDLKGNSVQMDSFIADTNSWDIQKGDKLSGKGTFSGIISRGRAKFGKARRNRFTKNQIKTEVTGEFEIHRGGKKYFYEGCDRFDLQQFEDLKQAYGTKTLAAKRGRTLYNTLINSIPCIDYVSPWKQSNICEKAKEAFYARKAAKYYIRSVSDYTTWVGALAVDAVRGYNPFTGVTLEALWAKKAKQAGKSTECPASKEKIWNVKDCSEVCKLIKASSLTTNKFVNSVTGGKSAQDEYENYYDLQEFEDNIAVNQERWLRKMDRLLKMEIRKRLNAKRGKRRKYRYN